MIHAKHIIIQEIPVIEIYANNKENEALPLIVFYHGWESRKERVLEYGYTLALLGFRVILPEAWKHGERAHTEDKEQDSLDFWKVVGQNVKELPVLVDYYLKSKQGLENKIAVGGVSMGGISASAMLAQYSWIHSAAVLMGSPAPIDFSKWLLENYTIEGIALYDLLDQKEIEKKLTKLSGLSLNLQPEKIANRPVYFWHGTEDPTVPIHLTQQFIRQIEGKPYSKQVEFEWSEGVEHEVPREIVLKTGDFFDRVLNGNER